MNIKTNSIVVVFLIAVVSFSSCSKDGKNTLPKNLPNLASSIPFFSSIRVVEDVLDSALSMDSMQELIEYEEAQQRASIGRLSDVFYAQVDPEQFNSREQILNYVAEHSYYLDTLIDEKGEISVEPKFSNCIFRYVANSDGLFAVADTIYKIFKNGIVFADRTYSNSILSLREENLATIDTSIFQWVEITTSKDGDHSATCNYKKHFSEKKGNGNNRLLVDYYLLEYPISQLFYKPYLQIKSQRLFIFWWNKSREITLSYDFQIHYLYNGNWESPHYYSSSIKKTRSKWIIPYPVFWVPNYSQDFVHLIRGGYIKSSTDQTGIAKIEF